MIGMQYTITLPSDYDMTIIKKRVEENGFKTDSFPQLLFKCYLIQEKGSDGFENVYAPLYVWKDSSGMNAFIFEGFYDNIIKSFGWHNIHVGIPLTLDLSDHFNEAKYALELTKEIEPRISLEGFKDRITNSYVKEKNLVGMVCIYNPDKWRYSQFFFYKDYPKSLHGKVYQILHISEG